MRVGTASVRGRPSASLLEIFVLGGRVRVRREKDENREGYNNEAEYGELEKHYKLARDRASNLAAQVASCTAA